MNLDYFSFSENIKHNIITTALAYDALNLMGTSKASNYYIPMYPKAGYTKPIFGPAFTTKGSVVVQNLRVGHEQEDYDKYDLIRYELYKPEYFKNNPVVILEANDNKVAHSGDITSTIYKTLGAVGFVTEGLVRDGDLIDKLGFPTFCNGIVPIDALGYWAITAFDTKVVLKGTTIYPGDLIFADKDGVIVVPSREDFLQDFFKAYIEVMEKEQRVRVFINNNKQEIYKNCIQAMEKFGRW